MSLVNKNFIIGDKVVATMKMNELTQANVYTIVDHDSRWVDTVNDQILDMHVSVINDAGESWIYSKDTFVLLSEVRTNRISDILRDE